MRWDWLVDQPENEDNKRRDQENSQADVQHPVDYWQLALAVCHKQISLNAHIITYWLVDSKKRFKIT